MQHKGGTYSRWVDLSRPNVRERGGVREREKKGCISSQFSFPLSTSPPQHLISEQQRCNAKHRKFKLFLFLSMLFPSTKPFSSSLQSSLKRGFTPTPNSINTFFHFLLNLRKFNIIINLFHQFTTNKFPITPKTHTFFTWALLNTHSLEQAERFMKKNQLF